MDTRGQTFCAKVCKTLYHKDPLMDFIYIWHDGRYRYQVLITTIPVWWPDYKVKVTDIEFASYLEISFFLLSISATIVDRTFKVFLMNLLDILAQYTP